MNIPFPPSLRLPTKRSKVLCLLSFKKVRPFRFRGEGRAEDKDSAEGAEEGHPLAEDNGGQDDRRNGIGVGKEGDGLRFQPRHTPEIEEIRKPGVNDANDDGEEHFLPAHLSRRRKTREPRVRKHGDGGGKELYDRFGKRIHAVDELCEDNDRREKRGAAESAEDTDSVGALREPLVEHTRNEDHTDERKHDADQLFRPELFLKDQRGEEQDYRRLHITAERRGRHRRVVERLEEEYPVDTYAGAGGDEQDEIFSAYSPENLFPGDEGEKEYEGGAGQTAQEGERRRRERDRPSEYAYRTEDNRRYQEQHRRAGGAVSAFFFVFSH